MHALAGRRHCHCCGRFACSPVPVVFECPECRLSGRPFAFCRAYGPYEGVLREAVHRFKYGGRTDLAAPLGEMMARTARLHTAYHDADLLVPIPLTDASLRRRRFNQAALLAGVVGRELGVPVRPVLAKVRETPAQAGLPRAARLGNLSGCFTVVGAEADGLRGRMVVLVDDVFTTGSTLSEAARVLRESGATRVLGLVFVAGRS